MTFKTEIEITPDPDGIHCGECQFQVDFGPGCPGHCEMWSAALAYHLRPHCTTDLYIRCPACLAAEQESRERDHRASVADRREWCECSVCCPGEVKP